MLSNVRKPCFFPLVTRREMTASLIAPLPFFSSGSLDFFTMFKFDY
ncbi:MAG: hypothetical protein ACD_25C00258G0002 [uncultured bacterium]|nr:MAG: hypothetical protein ACD_25C00258G0002 [uncultured bacterium]